MGTSYPDRTNARGIWKLSDITKNILGEGTYPRGVTRGMFAGGTTGSAVNKIDLITVETSGNATDFGDLATIVKKGTEGTCSSFTRGIMAGGNTPDYLTTIQYFDMTSSATNAADFGDLTVAGAHLPASSNDVKAVMGPRRQSNGDPNNTLDQITTATLGNATDFGDATAARRNGCGAGNSTRGLQFGGEESGGNVNKIEFIEFSSASNATDFGDLSAVTADMCASSNKTRAVIMGGSTPSESAKVDTIQIGSLGNSTDFGDLTSVRSSNSGLGNLLVAISAGGWSGSGYLNIIESRSIITAGNFSDFGDLTVAVTGQSPISSGHGGLAENFPRAPELYSPTGKVVPRGLGAGDIGIFSGGKLNPAGTVRNDIQFVQISTTGNSQIFGDLTASKYGAGGGASSTRGLFMGGFVDPATSQTATDYFEFSTKGNAASFGTLTAARAFSSGCSNSTRSLMMGGSGPSPGFARSNVVDYFTIASIGNASDFGDLSAARSASGATANSTRALVGSGNVPGSDVNIIEYFTIGSTGNATDFGDMTARSYPSGLASSTRGVFAGGYSNDSSANINVIDYVTIGSTGDSTDFGDLTVARSQSYGGLSNNIRGVFVPGTNPDNSTIDYITIASTGNATDFGDPVLTGGDFTSGSNGHGGL